MTSPISSGVPHDPAASPHGYLRRHLAEHAADGEMLDSRVLDPALLPHLDADRLRRVLPRAPGDPATRDTLAVWRRATHHWDMADPAANAATLDFTYRALGRSSPLPATLTGGWRTHLSGWPAASEILAGHTGGVSAVATTHLDGQPIAITTSWDDTARIWDLTTGALVGAPLAVPGEISALQVLETGSGDAISLVIAGTGLAKVSFTP